MTDSKLTDSKNIDYIILSVDQKEYRRMNVIDKFRMTREGNKHMMESSCKNCNEKIIEYYKSTYTINNPQIYDKKNVPINERAKELYYVYGECSKCNTKQRIGDKILSIKYA